MGRRSALLRSLIATFAVLSVLVSALVGTGAQRADAADLSKFKPGNIISDAAFFNAYTMDAPAVQSFLNSKQPKACTAGYTCLKDYRQDTFNRAADPMCAAYSGAVNESAAQIIVKVARACGINPQVLVVLLQKEQGLVTSTAPSTGIYRIATGYGCPDTAPCDSQYFGFYNQVYKAAWAFKRYSNPAGTGPGTPWSTVYSRYAPGKYADVLFHPNSACGSTRVYIENQATASLYFYTPYQPNQRALQAGYGTGDSCSAYGNRNFYSYMADWFGVVNYEVKGSIGDYWRAKGGAAGWLGEPVGPELYQNGGWKQSFQGGTLYAYPNSPVYVVKGSIGTYYNGSYGAEASGLGWPVAEEKQVGAGWTQAFQNGIIYCLGNEVHAVKGAIGSYYRAAGEFDGPAGWPTGDETAVGTGWTQRFQNGTVYTSGAGSHFLPTGTVAEYNKSGGAAGPLGYPEAGPVTVAGGWVLSTTGGAVVATSGGVFVVKGDIGAKWKRLGGQTSPLGLPTGSEIQRGDGWLQNFERGTMYARGGGTWEVVGGIKSRYDAAGAQDGPLGWPSASPETSAGSTGQVFTKAAVTAAPDGTTFVVKGSIGARYVAHGGWGSYLGWPRSEEQQVRGGWSQSFDRGVILSSGYGTFVVQGALSEGYSAVGGVTGDLGWPVAAERWADGGWSQRFEGGTVYSSSAGTFAVKGTIGATHRSMSGPSGVLGFPAGPETALPTGWIQRFQQGSIYVPRSGPVLVAKGAIGGLYAQKDLYPRLGVPTTAETAISGGWSQSFQNGVIYAPRSGGASWVGGDILAKYRTLGTTAGQLGFPVESEQTVTGGWTQRFAGGAILTWGGGTFSVKGAIGAHYLSLGGQTSGLGWPTTEESRTADGGWTQSFQRGRIVTTPNGAVQVLAS